MRFKVKLSRVEPTRLQISTKNDKDTYLAKEKYSLSRSRKMVYIIITALLLAFICIAFSGGFIKKYAVTIVDKGNETLIFSDSTEPKVILKEAGIKLSSWDKYTITPFNSKNQATLTIRRSFLVTVVTGKKQQMVSTLDEKVSDLLSRLKIKYGEDDIVTPSVNSKIKAGSTIRVIKVTREQVISRVPVPFKTTVVYTPSLYDNEREIRKSGIDGEKEVTTNYVYYDGKIHSQKVVKETVIKKAVSAVVVEGKTGSTASRLTPPSTLKLDKNGIPTKYKKKISGKATAYSARGMPTKLIPGLVAMDNRKFPRGTKMYIRTPSGDYIYGYSQVGDTGTAVEAGTILVDLFFETYEESRRFGLKNVDIYILE